MNTNNGKYSVEPLLEEVAEIRLQNLLIEREQICNVVSKKAEVEGFRNPNAEAYDLVQTPLRRFS